MFAVFAQVLGIVEVKARKQGRFSAPNKYEELLLPTGSTYGVDEGATYVDYVSDSGCGYCSPDHKGRERVLRAREQLLTMLL